MTKIRECRCLQDSVADFSEMRMNNKASKRDVSIFKTYMFSLRSYVATQLNLVGVLHIFAWILLQEQLAKFQLLRLFDSGTWCQCPQLNVDHFKE